MSKTMVNEEEIDLLEAFEQGGEKNNWKPNLPRRPNYDNIYYYKKSKKIFAGPVYQVDTDKAPISCNGEFFYAKRNLSKTETRLGLVQERAERKKKYLKKQWADLKAKEIELRNNFVSFEKFLGDNQEKKTRAIQNYQHWKTSVEGVTESINEMKEKLPILQSTVDNMEKDIKKHDIYANYLQNVVDAGNFSYIQQVVKRYLLLDETKVYLGSKLKDTVHVYVLEKSNYADRIDYSQLEYLNLMNKLSAMRKRYDTARDRAIKAHALLENINQRFINFAENINWAKMALQHMYEMTYHRVTERHPEGVKDRAKILKVGDTIKMLQNIENNIRRLNWGKKSHLDISLIPEVEPKCEMRIGDRLISKISLLSGKSMESDVDLDVVMAEVEDEHFIRSVDYIPIKLSPTMWMGRKVVRNFEQRYSQALKAIRHEKMLKNLDILIKPIPSTPQEDENIETQSIASDMKSASTDSVPITTTQSDTGTISSVEEKGAQVNTEKRTLASIVRKHKSIYKKPKEMEFTLPMIYTERQFQRLPVGRKITTVRKDEIPISKPKEATEIKELFILPKISKRTNKYKKGKIYHRN